MNKLKFSVKPESWGPHAWIFLHSIALQYPEHPTNTQKMEYKLFFRLLSKVLPCIQCQNHFMEYLQHHEKQFNDAFKNRKTLFEWTLKFHNYVNEKLNKPIYPIKSFKIDI